MNPEYYIISKCFSLDSNQWSILIGGIGVFLTLIGFVLAFIIYQRQRNDNAVEAYIFFQAFMPTLKIAVSNTIDNLNKFHSSLLDPNDDFIIPIISSSLSDRFLSKINIIDLNRYYNSNVQTKYDIFKKFIVSSNFIGDYHDYFTTEIDFFREHYKEKEQIYSDWQLLKSNKFFTSIYDKSENPDYKSFYANWVSDLCQDKEVFEISEEGFLLSVISRKLLVERHVDKLRREIQPYISESEKANEINLIANKIVMAYTDITAFKERLTASVSRDIVEFKQILVEINTLIE